MKIGFGSTSVRVFVLVGLIFVIRLPQHQAFFVPSTYSESFRNGNRMEKEEGLLSLDEHGKRYRSPVLSLSMAKTDTNTMDPEEMKQLLQEYLQKRQELNADELARQ